MAEMDRCPTEDEFRQAIDGSLSAADQERIERHLDGCVDCQQRCTQASPVFPVDPEAKAVDRESQKSTELQQVIERLTGGGFRSSSLTAIHAEEEWVKESLRLLEPSEKPGSLGRLEHYEISSLIGRGGMGVVFEALDTVLHRTVAIKVLYPAAVDAEVRRRLLREARAAAALQHENVVAIYAVHFESRVPLIVLQYIQGESLADRLRRHGPLPEGDLLRLALETARGLAAAHARGIVHRDIKPANILLEHGTGCAKIADFGLATIPSEATLTREGMFAGTPEFTSPEQALGKPADARSDLFSLGASLYLAATGTSPFAAEQPLLVLDRVRQSQPPPMRGLRPTLPAWFCDIVHQLLAKDPRQRIASAEELIRLLECAQPPGRKRGRSRRRTVVALVVTALLITLGVLLLGPRDRRPDPPPAVSNTPKNGFIVTGREWVFDRLADAIASADDGGVIEVHGDGPFPIAPLQTNGKRLTIRAGDGSRPVFIGEAPNQNSDRPMIDTDADLRLEGVTIYWRTHEPPAMKPESSMMSTSAVASSRSKLSLRHCRIVAAGGCSCVGISGGDLVVTNCHLVCGNGSGVYWRPVTGGNLTFDASTVEGSVGLTLSTVADAPGAGPAIMNLTGNTFVGDKFLQLTFQVGPKQPVHVNTYGNIFDHGQIVNLYATKMPKNFLPDTAEKRVSLLRTLMKWYDESNLYRRGQALGLDSALAPRQTAKSEFAGLNDWLRIWEHKGSGSVDGKIRFHERKAKETEAPKLDRVDVASGPVPAGIGANADQVGPR